MFKKQLLLVAGLMVCFNLFGLEIKTKEGKAYRNVKIIRFNSTGILFMDNTGKKVFLPRHEVDSNTLDAIQISRIDLQHAAASATASIQGYDHYQGPNDRSTAQGIKKLLVNWLENYKKNPEGARKAYLATNRAATALLLKKPIVGSTYNPILKKVVEVSIDFNVYADSNNFYLKVGDGKLSTVASFSTAQLAAMKEGIKKIQSWAIQRRQQGLNTAKSAGIFGGVSLSLVTEEKGKHIMVRLDAKGPFARDRMIEEQTVFLNLLNLAALQAKLFNAHSLIAKRGPLPAGGEAVEELK